MLKNIHIHRYENGCLKPAEDQVIEECQVDILLNGRIYASVMATPARLDHLALGFLFGEKVIKGLGQVKSLAVEGLKVGVEILSPAPPPPARARSSGFGLGSVAVGAAEELAQCPPRPAPASIAAGRLIELMEEFNRRSELFRKSGAVHSSALVVGRHFYFAEDVGRHNALDKVIGAYLADGFPAGKPALALTSGRGSTEIMIQAAGAGLGGLVSRSAPTDRSVELARRLNLLLVGFARGVRFNVYHGAEKITRGCEPGATGPEI